MGIRDYKNVHQGDIENGRKELLRKDSVPRYEWGETLSGIVFQMKLENQERARHGREKGKR